MSALQPIYNLPIAYKQGGQISVASNTTLSIASILTRSMSDDLDINVGDYFGAQTATTLNAAVVGLNGIDTGALAASSVYAVYAVADQAGYNPSGFLLSLSATTPLLPNGVFPSHYNTFVRIGWAVTDASSHFKVLFCSGAGTTVKYTYDVPIAVLTTGAASTQTAISLATVVPAVNLIPVQLGCALTPAAASRTATLCTSGGTIASSRNILTGQVAAVVVTQVQEIPATLISSLPKVDYIMSNADSSLTMYVVGFTDYLL